MNIQLKKSAIYLWLIVFFCISTPGQESEQKQGRFTITVTDGKGRYANTLKPDGIQLLIDNKQQSVKSFVKDEAPATIVFLIDLSASQKDQIKSQIKEIERFIKSENPSNEYIIIAFNKETLLLPDKTENLGIEETLKKILTINPDGPTAFYDSVHLAIEKANAGKYQKKVLFVCSDGQDNESRNYKMRDIVDYLKHSNILFYGIDYAHQVNPGTVVPDLGYNLEKLAEIGGGRSFFPKIPAELSGVFDLIALELKSQYQIDFLMTDSTNPDKWREIKVKVLPVKDSGKEIKLTARSRNGFYLSSAK